MTFLFLEETHPRLAGQSDVGLKAGLTIMACITGKPRREGKYIYVPLSGDLLDNEEEAGHELRGLPVDTPRDGDVNSDNSTGKVFTSQITLQILSVSLLAFHKVSSDAIMPTFLAAPLATTTSQQNPALDLPQTTGGFGYNSQRIGFILLSQAIIAIITQATLIPFFIQRVGSLNAYRIVLCLYPVMYLFTPFLPNLISPLSLAGVVLELWFKVILSSVGYICSAVL
jgi:hypothetical protein